MKNIISKKIIYANINDSISKVSNLMKEHNIGFIPIKDNNDYVGVITDRDLALTIPYLKSNDDSIKPYITNNIISIEFNKSLEDALNTMSNNKIKRLLVKEKNSIIGILSLSDILNHTNDLNILNTIKSIFYINDNNKELESNIHDILT